MKYLILLICLFIVGCSSTRIMKDCKELGQGFYECSEP